MISSSVDDFFAMLLAICMIAVEMIALIVGAPIMGAMPVIIVNVSGDTGVIYLLPFMTAVTAVLFLFVMNLWFAKGFMNVIRNLQVAKKLREEYKEIEPIVVE